MASPITVVDVPDIFAPIILDPAVGVDDSSNYWLGSVAVNAPSLDLGSPRMEPRPDLSFLFLQLHLFPIGVAACLA
jgi:hypothetical protein